MNIGWLGWIVLILMVIFATGWGSYKIVQPNDWFDDENKIHWWRLVFWIPSSLLISLLGFILISVMIGSDPFNHYKRVEYAHSTTYIYSIGLHDNVSGHFSLGCGTVESKPAYYYYKKSGEGYVLDHVNATHSTIIETDTEKPCIKHIRYHLDGEASWLKKAFFGKNENFWRSVGDSPSTAKYKIYLPKGSIIQAYDISL